MRFPRLAALIPLAFSALTLSAQLSPYGFVPSRSGSVTTTHNLKTIWISPIANVPFSAAVLLQSGSTRSYEIVARDAAGRVFEQRYTVAPVGCADLSGDAGGCSIPEPWVTDRIYIDPIRQTAYDCVANNRHLCFTFPHASVACSLQEFYADPTLDVSFRTSPNMKMIDGLQATGVRETIPVFTTANPSPSPRQGTNNISIREIWYSPDLQIDLSVQNNFGVAFQSLQIKDLKRSNPAAELFIPPPEYKLTSTPLPPSPPTVDQIRLDRIRQAIVDHLAQSNVH